MFVVVCALAAPSSAYACSHDDSNYYETFVDATCLKQPLTNTTLDALGGLRLSTNGNPLTSTWDTDADFNNGISYQSLLFPPVGVSTLQTTGIGAPATLNLPSTPLPLTPDAANPVLGPTASTVGDGDNVDDPTVVKVGTTYYMWYTGYPEDGSAPKIFLATSADGTTWVRGNSGNPVLQGTAGAFDADGVYGADVVYDPTDLLAPYKMWFSGRHGVFGGIGYASSLDGLTWTQYGGATPLPVLDHGIPGSADSFSAADPSVLKDGSVWKMWYTGDDSNRKRIAYATSTDGMIWAKGGKVIAPEDPGASANIGSGAFSPTVWKTTSGFSMLLTGRKLISGGTTYQTKIMETTSTDGLVWTGPSPALNPSGTNTNFDFSNLDSPDVLYDPGTTSPYKAYYSGNTIDANGNFHTRIGMATSKDGASFAKVNGALTGGSVLDVGAAGTAFDARQASGVSVAAPAGGTPKFVGFYWGTRGSDFKPRLGEATSSDGSVWTKVAVSGANGGALFGLGNPASFDNGGERDPSVLYDSGAYAVYFTGFDSSGTASIGVASAPEVSGTKQPDNTAWSARSQLLAKGSTFDSAGVSHPSVIQDAANSYFLYYGGSNGTTWSIGRATATSTTGPFTKDAAAVLTPTAGTFDAAGVKDPVVAKIAAGDYRMLYTGVDADGIERVGYATSTNGSVWTKQGVVLNPSMTPFAADESGVEPTGMLVDGATVHVWTSGIDRTGRTRGEHATTPFPTVSGTIPSGWASYQLGNSSTTIEDFRQIARTSNGAVSLFVSFLQPYSGNGGGDFWSDYFPITLSSPSEALNFLLTVHAVRWRAQLTTPSSIPSLNTVQLTSAPVSFFPSGSASSNPIGAPTGQMVTAWGSLTVNTSIFSPGGSGTGSGTVQVLDGASSQQLATAPLNTAGTTTVDLSTISAASHPTLDVAFALQASGQATPLVHSFTVSYTSQAASPVLTLAASPVKVVFGSAIKLNGVLSQNGAGLSGQSVALAGEPFGTSTFKSLATVMTDTSGAYSAATKPAKQTVYQASAAGVTTPPTVTVKVAQRITLSVRRSGAKVYLKGSLGPKKRRRVIVIQVRTGKSWHKLGSARTSKKSIFKLVKTLKPGHVYKFRATTAAYPGLLGGTSKIVTLRK
jgi:predicted GH43/DUF377 family glycosyl hydrolase